MPNHFKETLYPAGMLYLISLAAAAGTELVWAIAIWAIATAMLYLAIYDDYREGRDQEPQN